MKKKIESGDIFKLNSGGSVTVLEFVSRSNITAMHNDEFAHKFKTTAYNLESGHIKNPFFPSVFGVGYLGYGKYRAKKNGVHDEAYCAWKDMHRRCYDENFHLNRGTYADCVVCEDWHNYQTFAEWFYKQKRQTGWQLDKDILISGNREYSTRACRFVPVAINSLFSRVPEEIKNEYTGVRKVRSSYRAELTVESKRISLGTYKSAEEASVAYVKAKNENVKRVANNYREFICNDIYTALINFSADR